MAIKKWLRGAAVVVLVSLFLILTGVVASEGHLVFAAAVVTLGVVLTAAVVTAWSSFANFICGAIVLRPLLDLTAGPRSAGLSVTDVFGGAVLVVCLIWLWFNRSHLALRMRSRLAAAMVALVVVMALSAAGAPNVVSATQFVLRVLAGVAVFFVFDILLHLGTLTIGRVLGVLGLAYVVPILYPLLGLVGIPVSHEKDGVTALKSVFYLSNNYGHFLVPLVIVTAAWFLRTGGRSRVLCGVLLGVAGIELLATETRGAWLAALTGLLCVGLLLNRQFVFVALAGAVFMVLFVPAVNARFMALVPDDSQPRNESSLAWRIGHWGELLPLSMEEPLLGLGPNESVYLTGKEPHNDYVRALVETGVLGLAAYLWFLYELLAVAWRATLRVGGTALSGSATVVRGPPRLEADAWTQATIAALGAYMIATALASIAENLIDNLTFLWIVMPCAAVLQWTSEAGRTPVTVDPTAAAPTEPLAGPVAAHPAAPTAGP